MRRNPYNDAIKAIGRLAVAAGAEPRDVRDKLGPQAVCDTTAARRKAFVDLIADVNTAVRALALPIVELSLDPLPDNATLAATDPDLRRRIAATTIEYGVSIIALAAEFPGELRRRQHLTNGETIEEFMRLSDKCAQAVENVERHVTRLHMAASRGANDTDVLKACQKLLDALDEHEEVVHKAFQTANQIRWRATPRLTTTRRKVIKQILPAHRATLAANAEIRRLVKENAPGPL